MNLDEQVLESLVRKVVGELMAAKMPELEKDIDPKTGIMSIKAEKVVCEKFDTGHINDKVYLKDVLSLDESPRLGCGMMEMDNSAFEWTLKYDEIDYVIDGVLEIRLKDKTIRGEKGDIIFIPKDSDIVFATPSTVIFMYVTYPANWSEQ